MTWFYDISEDGSQMEIIDHSGTVVKTVDNDGSGFELPGAVLSVMRTEAAEARSNGDMSRWRDIQIHISADDIAADK
jgi:hypothetical protein